MKNNDSTSKLNETRSVQSEVPTNAKTAKTSPLLWFGLGVVVTALIGGGIYLSTNKTAIPNPPLIPSPTAYTSPDTSEMTNWKTYSSSHYGFELKYPTEITLYESKDKAKMQLLSNIPPCDPDSSVICLYYMNAAYSGTNFKGAALSVNVLNNLNKEVCISYSDYDKASLALQRKGTTNISGTTFNTAERGSAAAGNQSQDRIFRTFSYTCFEIIERINTDSSDVNSPAGTVRTFTEADSQQVVTLLNQILTTFRWYQPPVINPGASSKSDQISPPGKKLIYQLPQGWKTVQDATGTFEIGYDPNKSVTYDGSAGKSINPLTITLAGVWSTNPTIKTGYNVYVTLKPYDGGSRHKFLNVSDWDKLSNYHEKEYTYNGWSCLVIYGVQLSQSDTNWGMCAMSNTQAFLISAGTWSDEMMEQIIRTIRLLK